LLIGNEWGKYLEDGPEKSVNIIKEYLDRMGVQK